MATALKHKQRGHRSYQDNRKIMGSVAISSARLANSHQHEKQGGKSWMDSFKQMFCMGQKGDR